MAESKWLWRIRAAEALDATHRVGERGSRTYLARQRVTTWLDSGGKIPTGAIRWLEYMAKIAAKNPPLGWIPARAVRFVRRAGRAVAVQIKTGRQVRPNIAAGIRG